MGCVGLAHIPDALALRSEYKIEVPQIMKAALALVNIRHTDSNVALFGQYQAARTWPFLPDETNAECHGHRGSNIAIHACQGVH
jgi:hypothetical protein